MFGYLLHLGTSKQINSGFGKYPCILLPFKQNMYFSWVFKQIYFRILFLAVPQSNAVKPLICYVT